MRARFAAVAFAAALVALAAFPLAALAHDDDPCHRLRTCPSDLTPPDYRCGDNRRFLCDDDNEPEDASPTEDLTGPPDREECQEFPQYYTERVCAAALGRPVPVSPRPAAASPAPGRPLPRNGAEEALLALSGLTAVETGYGLMLIAERMKRRRRGPVYLQPTLF